MSLAEITYATLCTLTTQRTWYVAYSGGLDSHVLLHALASLPQRHQHYVLKALHVNHGLSLHADDWEAHCKAICATLAVTCHVEHIQIPNLPQHSIEAEARTLRYQALARYAQQDVAILSAHHQDDQAETLLLQLLRGSGPKGLAAMPPRKQLGQGELLRPLLSVNRQTLLIYAQEHGLQWVEDESNQDIKFRRNFLRHQVLPTLKQQWPEAQHNLAKSAAHCAKTTRLLDELATLDLAAATTQQANQLLIEPLKKLSTDRQENALRYFMSTRGVTLPGQKKLQHIITDLLYSAIDATPCVSWGDVVLRRYRNQIYLLPNKPSNKIKTVLNWNVSQALMLPAGLGTLMAKSSKGNGINQRVLTTTMQVCFRCGGERMHPVGRDASQTLKKLFQEWAVPPWERDQVPLLYLQDQLVCVVGYAIQQGYEAKADEVGWVFEQIR